MKKPLASIIAAALLLPAAAPALAYDRNHHDNRARAAKAYAKGWRKGERFDRRYAPYYREIDYRHFRRLAPPPRGYHWVRSGNDAVLVAIAGGLIASVVANAF